LLRVQLLSLLSELCFVGNKNDKETHLQTCVASVSSLPPPDTQQQTATLVTKPVQFHNFRNLVREWYSWDGKLRPHKKYNVKFRTLLRNIFGCRSFNQL